jgi:predicted ArsR family transcriptional regulator
MPRRTSAGDLGALALLLDPARDKLYHYVARQVHPVSRDDAAAAVGISRAMAAFHLDKLVEAGHLRTEFRRLSGRTGRGAGRPAKLYVRSRHRFDVSLPQREPELLARLLAESIAEPASELGTTREAAQACGRGLGARARRRLRTTPTPDRLARCVEDVLEDVGFEPTPADGETWARNCPFDPLSRDYPAIVCQTALAIIGGVIDGVGAPSLGVTRRERSQWCCVVLQQREAS